MKDSNPRRWWKHTKQIIGQRGDSDASLKALATSTCGGDYKKLANMINETYQSVTKDLPKLDMSVLPPPTNPVPDKYIINIETVEKKLAHINLFKALGPDSIPNWILRDLCSVISRPICAIFNSSLREGFFPALWKSAIVINLPKVNPPQDIKCDLRPISLTPVLSKVMESIVGEWLWEFVGPQIGKDQFGCLKGSSTTHALVDMLHHWHLHAERMKISRVLLLDYSKAFDLVDHNILVKKLYSYGVTDILVRWIGSFLSDRRQRVRIGQEISDWLHVNGSVPQGSLAGTITFCYYD